MRCSVGAWPIRRVLLPFLLVVCSSITVANDIKPDRPFPPTVSENREDGTVVIEWVPLPEGTATSYVILASEDHGKFKAITTRIPHISGQAKISEALPEATFASDVRYSFRVAALNFDTKAQNSRLS